jgi:hypothetical protein
MEQGEGHSGSRVGESEGMNMQHRLGSKRTRGELQGGAMRMYMGLLLRWVGSEWRQRGPQIHNMDRRDAQKGWKRGAHQKSAL